MKWTRIWSNVRSFLESMYGLRSYDEEQFRAEIHNLVKPPADPDKREDEAASTVHSITQFYEGEE
jgi:hypothetical protein